MINDKDLEHLIDADPQDYQRDDPEEVKEYIYQAEILDADTNEVIAKISSFSETGLEEEMGKSKWTKAVGDYEAKLQKEKEEAEAEERFMKIDELPIEEKDAEEVLPEDDLNKEKEAELINEANRLAEDID